MNPLEQQEAAEGVTSLYMDLEERIMQNIIRHIKTWDQPIPSDEWQMERLAEIGKLDKEHIRIIAQTAGLSPTAIERMLEETAEKTMGALEPGLKALARRGIAGEAVPIKKSRSIKQVMKHYRAQAKDTLNTCNTTMLYKARDTYMKLVMDTVSLAKEIEEKQQYLNILNRGVTSVITGADARQQALRRTIIEFNERGIPAFVDRRGRQWTPEAYVNMCMRATSGSTAADMQLSRCQDYGIDLVEVDSHSGARPKCARDQGKIFDRSNTSDKYPHWDTSSYGEPDGLLGINCGHHIYPYVEGVNIRRYFPTEDMDANDRRYKEIQQQRALERSVRKQKRECMLFDELGDQQAFEEASVKLKKKEQQLSQYVKQKDLPRRRNREQVVGFDRKVSAEAVAANKKYIAKYSRYRYNKEGNILVTDDWKSKGKVTIPKKYRTYAVIETKETKGGEEQINRTFYDANGMMEHQVHSGPHGNRKRHPYGENGEHRHEYEWNEDGTPKSRRTLELTSKDRKENQDIL